MITQKSFTNTIAVLTAGLFLILAGCATAPQGPCKFEQGICQLVKDDKEAIKSANVDRIMANYSKGYKNDGRDYEGLRKVAEQYAPILAGYWEIDIQEVKMDSSTMATVTKGTLSNTIAMGQNIAGMQLIKEDGKWKWYGNRK